MSPAASSRTGRRRAVVVWAIAVVLLASCIDPDPTASDTTPDASPATTVGESLTTSTDDPVPETTIPVPDEAEPCVSGDQPFSQDGPMEATGSAGSDADLIAAISWEVFGSCEQVAVAFVSAERAPAVDPPEVRPLFFRSSGVLRLEMSEAISGSAVVDQAIETALVDRAYVARAIDGRVLVDLHLSEPAFVRVSPRSREARIVVDLIPGGPAYPSPATAGETTVLAGVTSPELRYPLTVAGMMRSDEDEAEALLRGPEGATTAVDVALAPPGVLWRAFDVVFPSGPSGPVTIEVGDAPALGLVIP